MQNILITGASGLLGANLILQLLEDDYKIKALLRDPSRFELPPHRNLECIKGNLFDDLSRILNGIDIVIHAAAETRQDLTGYDEYRRINCNATIQLFETAKLCHVKKFVFVSTANTIGYGSDEFSGIESNRISYPFSNSNYAKSKKEAEDHLLSNKEGIEVLIINPTFMLGSNDSKPSSGKIIIMGWKKKILFYPPGGKNFVHVRDVAKGIVSALSKGKSGEKYLMANENLSYREFFNKMHRITNQNSRMIELPETVLMILGYIGDFFRRVGIKTSLSSTNMKILCIRNYYSNQKAEKDLEIEFRPVDEAIKDSIRYFQEKGYVR